VTGPTTLVLLPGMDGTTALFRAFIEALPKGFDAIPVVYPPHVVLERDELRALAERALPDDRPFVLVGESFSGPLAVEIAARAPKGLAGLVLVSSFLRAPVAWPRFWRAIAREEIFFVTPPRALVRAVLLGRDASTSTVDAARAAVSSVAPRVLVHRAKQVLHVDVTSAFASLEVPVLALFGARDRLVGARARAHLAASHRGAQSVVVDGPHLLLQHLPSACARIVAEFCVERARADRAA